MVFRYSHRVLQHQSEETEFLLVLESRHWRGRPVSLRSQDTVRVRLCGEDHSTENPRLFLPVDVENCRMYRWMRFRILNHCICPERSFDFHWIVSSLYDDHLELENRREDYFREYFYTRRGWTDHEDNSDRTHRCQPIGQDVRTVVHVGSGYRWESRYCERQERFLLLIVKFDRLRSLIRIKRSIDKSYPVQRTERRMLSNFKENGVALGHT